MSRPLALSLACALSFLCGCRPAAGPAPKDAAPSAPVAAAMAPAAPTVTDETTPTAAGAQAFVDDLYKAEFSPAPDSYGPSRSKVYDAAMLKLMALDQCLSDGEVGALDGDPLCDCQDPGGMKAKAVVASADASTAAVKVQLTDGPKFSQTITLDLVFENGHWRVHDVDSDGESLIKMLQVSNAKPNKLLAACTAKL